MSRWALGIEYDGTDFVGWQAQRNGRSIQSELEAAVARVADHTITVHGAGRTDTGVHASNQVAHFDSPAVRTDRQWLLGINSNLPPDIAVKWARLVGDDFDARRSALWRAYRYTIAVQATRPALARRRCWWLRDSLDCAAMSSGAAYWLGERDFSAFRAAHCQSATPMRHLMSVGVSRHGAEIRLDFRANAFLYHMVRNMVGALVEIGSGRRTVDWARTVLAGGDRTRGAPTAPAVGLCLAAVAYPGRHALSSTVA